MSQTQLLIAALWQKNRPKIFAQLDLLERAAQATPLPEDQRQQVAAIAHKLAGALGMYGFPAATEPARALEQALNSPHPDPATLERLTQLLRQSLNQAEL